MKDGIPPIPCSLTLGILGIGLVRIIVLGKKWLTDLWRCEKPIRVIIRVINKIIRVINKISQFFIIDKSSMKNCP